MALILVRPRLVVAVSNYALIFNFVSNFSLEHYFSISFNFSTINKSKIFPTKYKVFTCNIKSFYYLTTKIGFFLYYYDKSSGHKGFRKAQ